MYKRRVRSVFASVVVLVLLAAACGDDDEAAGGGSGGDGDAIRIGVILAESGALASTGKETREGLEYAVETINDDGGIDGRPLELVFADYQSQPELVVPTLRDLLSQDVVALTGLESTSVLASSAPIVEGAQVPILSTASGNPDDEWSFTAFPLYGYFDLMAEYPLSQGKTTMCGLDQPGAQRELQEQLVFPVFEEVGMPIQVHEGFEPGDRDLQPQLSVMRDGGCDAVYLASAGDSIQLVAQGVAALAMDDVIVVTHGGNANAANVAAIDENPEQVFYALPKVVVADLLAEDDEEREALVPVFDGFDEHFGRAPTPNQILGYSVIEQLTSVMRDGALTGPEIRDALETAPAIETAFGVFERSDEDHNGGTGYWIMGRYDPAEQRFVLEG